MTSFQSSPYSNHSYHSNFPSSPTTFPSSSSSSSPIRFDRPIYMEETASSPAYIESLETAELTLVQHLKTAGLRKQREIALIDEVMKIRTERKKIFSALNKVLSRQKAECARVGKLFVTFEHLIKYTIESLVFHPCFVFYFSFSCNVRK